MDTDAFPSSTLTPRTEMYADVGFCIGGSCRLGRPSLCSSRMGTGPGEK